MTFKQFMSRLSWRQMLIHFVANWFFIHAAHMVVYLCNTKLMDAMKHSNGQLSDKTFIDQGFTGADVLHFSLWLSISGFIGLLVAFIISIVISVKRHWFWVNALIVLVATYFLYVFRLLGWDYIGRIFGFVSKIFNNSTAAILSNFIMLLTIGLLVFLSKLTKQFADNNKPASV